MRIYGHSKDKINYICPRCYREFYSTGKYINTLYCSKKCQLSTWRDSHPGYGTKKINILYFNGNINKVLKRDKYKCQKCNMTNEEHVKKWGYRLTIHHKDGMGRYSNIKNNKIDNLITLCHICHGRIHGSENKKILRILRDKE